MIGGGSRARCLRTWDGGGDTERGGVHLVEVKERGLQLLHHRAHAPPPHTHISTHIHPHTSTPIYTHIYILGLSGLLVTKKNKKKYPHLVEVGERGRQLLHHRAHAPQRRALQGLAPVEGVACGVNFVGGGGGGHMGGVGVGVGGWGLGGGGYMGGWLGVGVC